MPLVIRKILALLVIHCSVLTAMAAPKARSRAPERQTAKIVFEPGDPIVRPGKPLVVKATAMDRNGKIIKGAKITWEISKEAEELLSISKPLNNADENSLVFVGLTPASGRAVGVADVKIRASFESVSSELVLHYKAEPSEIVFARDSIDVAPGRKETIVAKVRDAAGGEIHGLNVSWKLADKKFEDVVFLGPPLNNTTTNSIEVVWLSEAVQKSVKQVPIIASAGTASAVVMLNFKPHDETDGRELVFLADEKQTNEITISPQGETKIKAVVKDKDGATLPKVKVECKLSDDDRPFVALDAKPKGEFVFTGLGGDLDTTSRTILLPCTAENTRAVLVVRYDAGSVQTDWAVLPPNIVGDNYGRTITKNYYCIEVTINNNSGSDLALAGLRFVNAHDDVARPVASYSTVHGSLAKRKISHPRSLTLAIVGGLGTLMTGFNPFFHDANHGKNYSQFIDILSNPLKSGIEKAWQDPYPDELSRFEQDVLRDDKIIPSNTIFKTKVFVPKRSLYANNEKQRDDLEAVRRKLGGLQVLGYQFQKGPVRRVRTTASSSSQ